MSRQQRLVLIVSVLASFVAFMDGAIVNVALPAIQKDLGGGLAAQQWVVDAYLLTLGSLILIAGSLSDLLGRKKILGLGLLGFGVASVLCAVAPTSTALIISRALQGAAGALIVPSSLALIIEAFSGPAQGKAIGTWTAWTGIAFVIGPLAGGILVDYTSWRWIFAINVVPITLTILLMSKLAVGHTTVKAKVDYIGAGLCALALGGSVFALIEQPRYGWGSPLIYIPLCLGVILFIAFLIYEKRTSRPMLPLELFRNRNFSVGNVATLCIYAGLSVATFLVVVFLQQVAGYSALNAGLALLPVTIIMFVLSSRFGGLAGKYGPRLFMSLGPIIAAAGFLLMLKMDASVNYWTDLLPGVLVFGLGLSVTVAPLTAAILGDVASSQAGIASAVNNAVARVAGLVAIAGVGAVVALQFGQALDGLAATDKYSGVYSQAQLISYKSYPLQTKSGTEILDQASVSAFRAGMLTTAALITAGGVVSLAGIRNPKSN